jgi:hypothetical protein
MGKMDLTNEMLEKENIKKASLNKSRQWTNRKEREAEQLMERRSMETPHSGVKLARIPLLL